LGRTARKAVKGRLGRFHQSLVFIYTSLTPSLMMCHLTWLAPVSFLSLSSEITVHFIIYHQLLPPQLQVPSEQGLSHFDQDILWYVSNTIAVLENPCEKEAHWCSYFGKRSGPGAEQGGSHL
jgi:hypothetical protein